MRTCGAKTSAVYQPHHIPTGVYMKGERQAMKFNLYRCKSGYVLTADNSEPGNELDVGPLDFIGQLMGDSLDQVVYRRVIDEIAERAYAFISKADLGLA